MKTQLSFLSGISIICLSLFLLIFNCSSEIDIQTAEMQPPLTDVLTLELTIGGENDAHKEEYLLEQPQGITVNNEGDIFIGDESRIKVFDKDGNEKMIIGRSGQGPGEFVRYPEPVFNPTGQLLVMDSNGFNIYDQNFNFIEKKDIRTNQRYKNLAVQHGWTGMSAEYVILLNKTEKLILGSGVESLREKNEVFLLYLYNNLIIEKPDTLIEIATYRETRTYYFRGGGAAILRFMGELLWSFSRNNYVVYSHPDFDIIIEKNKSSYSLNVVSLNNFRKIRLLHQYTPVSIPDSVRDQHYNINEILKERGGSGFPKEIIDMIKKTHNYPPLQKLLIDVNTIFAFTHQHNTKKEYLTDIFDVTSGKYLKSAYFSIIPDLIKVGYAYKLKSGRNVFAEIHKYKIAPAVYGK